MTKREMWIDAINAVAGQQEWIEDHGGEAIYAADQVRLETLVLRANKLSRIAD